ncbi:MAG: hypothetical protein J6B89_05220 [Bacilli bacterium]|nr:hypothetical protein [Bacilli bacterium]
MNSISGDLYNKLFRSRVLSGSEAFLSAYKGDLMKLFYVLPKSSGYSKIDDLYLNKRKKLECIQNISGFSSHNLIYPKELYSVYNQFGSYTIPDRRDLSTLYGAKIRGVTRKIEILKGYRRILDYFHEQNIVFGDIKFNNMLLSSSGNIMGFCDLDNIMIGELPIDIMPRCSRYFCSKYGKVDYNLDSFMFNFLTLEYLLGICSPNFEEVFDFLDLNVVPNFSLNMDKVKVKSIFNELKNVDSNYSGSYIIDYIK